MELRGSTARSARSPFNHLIPTSFQLNAFLMLSRHIQGYQSKRERHFAV